MTISIKGSVGRNGVNNPKDIDTIQGLLDGNLHLLIPFDKLDKLDPKKKEDLESLISRIETFQRRVQPLSVADGRVDPQGQTLDVLQKNAERAKKLGLSGKAKLPLYPFPQHSADDPETGARNFGADRDGGRRKHAGIDLKFPPGTPIRAMADGEVVAPSAPFYDGVNALEVDHGSFIARYGEISQTVRGIDKSGAQVKRGQTIAFVGRLSSGNSMLHLELYTGVSTGPLTDRTRMPFMRRDDLLNPMEFIEASTLTDAPDQDERNARVSDRTASFLNVRDAAKLDATVIARLPPGSFLDVTDEVTGDAYDTDEGKSKVWYKVDINGTKGFAAAYFIDRVSTPSPGPEVKGPKVPTLDLVGAFGRVSSRVESKLNLRDKADEASASVGGLEPGVLLGIKQKLTGKDYDANGGKRNDWLEVEVKDGPVSPKSGFVAAFFVDPVFRVGQTSDAITTGLVVRSKPEKAAAQTAVLMPGTRFTVVSATTGGTYEDATGAAKNDWFEIEYQATRGFVAAAFVELIDPTDVGKDLNAILFTYEPTGASDLTARQDNLPALGIVGVAASEAMAKSDLKRVKPLAQLFIDAAKLFDPPLPPALLAAISSRESRCGAVLRDGFGDGGNAYGIMQVDRRFHSPLETLDGPTGQAHIDQATQILHDKLEEVNRHHEGLSDSQALQAAVSRYNGGSGLLPPDSDKGTTGGDYMNDVWARARHYARNIAWG